MKLFVAACFGTFILIMGLELVTGLISGISGRKKGDTGKEEKQEQKEE